jgi:O-antigen ligase
MAATVELDAAQTPASRGAVLRRQFAWIATAVAVLAIVAFNLNYLLVSWLGRPGVRYEAVAIAPEVPFLALLLGVGLLYVVVRRDHVRDWLGTLTSLSLFAFCGWAAILSVTVHGDPRAAVTLAVPAAIFVIGFGLARSIGADLSRTFAYTLPFVPLMLLGLLLLFLAADRLVFSVGGWLKPQVAGGIRSTEIAIFAGVQFWYCMFAVDWARQQGRSTLLARAGLIIAGFVLFWTLSVGSMGALVFLVALRALVLSNAAVGRWLFLFALVAGLGLAAYLASGSFLEELLASKVRDYSEEGIRLPTLLLLAQYIQSEPVTGIGLGQFAARSFLPNAPEGLYPHNNLLGIGAELGLPAALIYLTFIVFTAAAGIRAVHRWSAVTPARASLWPLAALGLLAFLYLQIKGLVQDTWQLKETYFWAGVVAGLLSPLRETRHE